MAFDEIVVDIQAERAHQDRTYRERNARHSVSDWLVVLIERMGHLAAAASSRDFPWLREECVKLAATATAIVEHLPGLVGTVGEQGAYVELEHVDTDRARIIQRVVEPPADAVLVTTGAKRAWISNGRVYVHRG